MTGGGRGRREGEDEGRVVPSYALTGGRTRSVGPDLPYEALVTTAGLLRGGAELELQPETRAILDLAAGTTSVAELSAALRLPIGVVRVLVGDLAAAGYLTVSVPPPVDDDGRPRREILERLLDGLRTR